MMRKLGSEERRLQPHTPSPRRQCLRQWPHPRGEEIQTLGHRRGTGTTYHRRDRVLRGRFQGGGSSKASSLEMLEMDSTTSQGWQYCGMSAIGGLGVHTFPLDDIVIACKSLYATQGR